MPLRGEQESSLGDPRIATRRTIRCTTRTKPSAPTICPRYRMLSPSYPRHRRLERTSLILGEYPSPPPAHPPRSVAARLVPSGAKRRSADTPVEGVARLRRCARPVRALARRPIGLYRASDTDAALRTEAASPKGNARDLVGLHHHPLHHHPNRTGKALAASRGVAEDLGDRVFFCMDSSVRGEFYGSSQKI